MVYVGKNEYRYGRMKMSHMIAESLEELHQMAHDLGIDQKHFQNKPGKPHYDICKQNKRKAIALGAVEVSDKQLVKMLKQWNQ